MPSARRTALYSVAAAVIAAGLWLGVLRDTPHPHEYASMEAVDLAGALSHLPEVRTRTLEYADFSGRSLDGRRVDALEWIRRYPVVLFTYVAEWCANCNYEAPVLAEAYWRFAERGLRIVARSEYSHREEVRRFAAEVGVPYPILVGSPNPDPENEDAVRTVTHHYRLRGALGDERKWGTPMSVLVAHGDRDRPRIVMGELIPDELFAYLDRTLPGEWAGEGPQRPPASASGISPAEPSR